MNNYIISCELGLEALVKKEVLKQWYEIVEVLDKAIYFRWWEEAIAKMNLWCRFGNRVYLELLSQDNIIDFDTYFDAVHSIDWEKYVNDGYMVNVKAKSIKSWLSSEPALQRMAKKSIIKKIEENRDFFESENQWKIDIQILIQNDRLKILLNTSWAGLFKRWYKSQSVEAPLKENLAAAIVQISHWKYSENFYDPFCGWGTIPIEAALIARNIAPGKFRNFAFMDFDFYPKKYYIDLLREAKEWEYDKKYYIYASDVDEENLDIAKENARNAWVEDTIEFSCIDFKEQFKKYKIGHIVSNPPYWLRLEQDNIDDIHFTLSKLFYLENYTGGIITSYPDFQNLNKQKFKKRKLYNGGELCYFYNKMS
jgi:putative N6-adenine-specific DNA methylase